MTWLQRLFSKVPVQQQTEPSREELLAAACPREFYNSSNPWTAYAGELLFHGKGRDEWKWKSDDEELREAQLAALTGVMDSRKIRSTTAIAIVAWKLSEMLSEPPTYVP